MINDIQLITKNAKNSEDSTVIVKVGSGKSGQPTIIKAQSGVRYELRDVVKNVGPDQLLFKRKGKDLLILLNAEGHASDKDQPADIIIENYYGESKAKLVGIAEDGQYYTYLPQEGTVDLLSWNVTDGASTYQSLGELHEQVAWLPFLLGGLAVAGAAAGAGGGGNNENPKPANKPPVAVDDTNIVVPEDGGPITLKPLTGDSDPDGDPLTITSIGGVTLTPGVAQTITVTGGTVQVSNTGVITFTPNPNYNGTVTIPYVVSDGKGETATANEVITVKPVNDPPVAVNDTYTMNEDGVAITLKPLTGDSDPDGDKLTVTSINGTPPHAGCSAKHSSS